MADNKNAPAFPSLNQMGPENKGLTKLEIVSMHLAAAFVSGSIAGHYRTDEDDISIRSVRLAMRLLQETNKEQDGR